MVMLARATGAPLICIKAFRYYAWGGNVDAFQRFGP